MQDHLPRKFRFAPFVVLIALVSYAVIVIAMLTAPDTAQAKGSAPATKVAIDTSNSTPWTLPSMPARCTDVQIAAGDVASCLISKYNGAAKNGWGTPPFPIAADGTLNAGWKSNGWEYSGSPALMDWEAALWKNADKVGTIRAGRIQAPPAALALFEGFLGEIQANGYRITDAISYNYRCTSNTRKDCVGLTSASLSNHAWGLGIDINVGANPEVRYFPTADSPTTACSVPMATNLPQWVVQTAEKWGLLWGGYGWSGGCTTPETVKSSVIRDPMHFEFRGTVEDAVKIASVNGVSVKRYCSNVVEAGTTIRKCTWQDRPQAGWRTSVPLQGPAGATSALVNITLTGASETGYVAAESCDGNVTGDRAWSNGNVAVGATVANLAVVPLDALGRFCLYNSTPMHMIVDAQGFFMPSRLAGSDATRFTPLVPTRVLDTRKIGSKVLASGLREILVNGIPKDSVALLTNLTVTATASEGYLAGESCDKLSSNAPESSNLNFSSNDTVANLAVVTLGNLSQGAGFCTWSNQGLHQIVDIQGVFTPGSSGMWGFNLEPQRRLVDTRKCVTDCAEVFRPGAMIKLKAPAGASAVLVNLTLTDAANSSFVIADRCSTLMPSTETPSNANVAVGRVAANLAVVPVDVDGSFCVYTSSATRVIVDIQGTFSPSADLRFIPVSSVRRFDSRKVAN
ncbi:MAG: M15 family metallopeptidase [Actinomycetota bacterium]|nr:M15 family metallopeptidase [Actinomycetota bacterium]MDA3020168.1 M15 family metallopeptidase [Actinomycetota bacterium]